MTASVNREDTSIAGEACGTLSELQADVEVRVRAIRENRPDWLCGKGCDSCCRRLADVPQLTAAEWKLLRAGLAALPVERLREICRDVAALAGQPPRPVVCPLLDQSSGACPVYAQRPIACRTYGFYVQRGVGLYCPNIESRVAAGALADVVWGNHDGIDRRLARLGEMRSLTDWFAGWERAAERRDVL
ncbi:MAG: YkgJ family cysteine cluster protein [Rhodocyclaceae bacterium]|nr:YkgJ family cysteine cluster protein [Rhodocyclaceae bacterium]